jgi:pimeloyl-[acyl-carrier protein] methyl ester esterase
MTLHVDSFGHGPSPSCCTDGQCIPARGVVAPRLARRHRVLAVDLPGHGHSTPLPAFTLDGAVAALGAALAASAQRLTVVGWSLGGLIAMRWALAQPECVARLVLIAATPRFVASEDWPHAMATETLARFGEELRIAWKPTVQRFLALQVRGSEHGRATLALMREQLFARGEPSPETLAGALAVLACTDLRADLAALTQPTLVVVGSRDTLALPGAGAWLAEHLPNAKCVSVPGAAHAPFLSHPEAFAAAVESFLDGC